METEIKKMDKKVQKKFLLPFLIFFSQIPFSSSQYKYDRKLFSVIFSFSDSAFLFATQFVPYIENGLLVRPH